MPSVTSVVARSYPDQVIGVENRLPWHLRTDLTHFKKLTQDHAIIMGRKTFQSLGRALPKRVNIVLSRSPIEESSNVRWARDPETALLLADGFSISLGQKELFVIGGENIYNEFFRYVNKIWVTDVFCGRLNGDAKFEKTFESPEWRTVSEHDHPASDHDDWAFRISCYKRFVTEHRLRSKEDFLKVDINVTERLEAFGRLMELDVQDDISSEQQNLSYCG